MLDDVFGPDYPADCDLSDVETRERVIGWLERLDLLYPPRGPEDGLLLTRWLVDLAGATGS